MFGTIGRAQLKPGSEAKFKQLMAEWQRDIRPKIAGEVVSYSGNKAGSPQELVFLALVHDEATYRTLAEMPEQDAWFQKFAALLEGEVTWRDVEMNRD